MSRFVSPLLALVFAFVLSGCSSPSTETPEPAPTATQGSQASPTASEPVAFKKDGKLWCPLMNKEVKSEADAKGFVDHEGTRYYFCCDMCAKNGSADPAKVKEMADKL